MSDLKDTVIPKSDQLNADDFLTGPKTIRITGVKVTSGEQPVSISYDGDMGKPYKPCKSMRRVLITFWGTDGQDYVGKHLTLYNDPSVKWAGKEIGGIRISHMSDIEKDSNIILTVSRAVKKQFLIQKLEINSPSELSESAYQDWVCKMDEAGNMDELNLIGVEISKCGYNESGKSKLGNYFREVMKKVRDK